jgi:hypothetical protein
LMSTGKNATADSRSEMVKKNYKVYDSNVNNI